MAESFKNFKGNLIDALAYQIPGNTGLSQEQLQSAIDFLGQLDDTDFEGISYNRDIMTVQTSESYLTDNTYYKGLFFINREEFLSRFNIGLYRPVYMSTPGYINRAAFENNYPEDSIFFVYNYKENGNTVNEPNNNYTYVEVSNKLSTVNNYNRFIKVWHNGLSKYLYIPFPENGRFTNGAIAFTSTVTGLDFTFYSCIYPWFSNLYGYTETDWDGESTYQHIVNFYAYTKQEFDEILRNYQIEKVYISQEEVTNNTPSYITSDRPEPEPEEPTQTEPGQSTNDISNTGGTGDRTSDVIESPEIPAGTTGLFGYAYALNLKQMGAIQGNLWDTDFLESLSSLTNAPQSAITGAYMVPFDLLDYTGISPASKLYLGNYEVQELADSTTYGELWHLNPTYAPKIPIVTGWKLQGRYGGFLDFEPYTKMTLYLPYIGFRTVSPHHFYSTPKTERIINIYYNFDVPSGQCKAKVEINNNILYEWSASMAVPISFSVSNLGQIKTQAALGTIGAAVSLFGGAVGGKITGEVLGKTAGQLQGILTDPLGKVNVQNTGNTGTSLERFDPQQAYLIIETTETAVPDDYNKNYGRPSLINSKLSDLKGFTTVPNPLFTSKCTSAEKEEITRLLQEGVIIL